jgi:hypothetical protein
MSPILVIPIFFPFISTTQEKSVSGVAGIILSSDWCKVLCKGYVDSKSLAKSLMVEVLGPVIF